MKWFVTLAMLSFLLHLFECNSLGTIGHINPRNTKKMPNKSSTDGYILSKSRDAIGRYDTLSLKNRFGRAIQGFHYPTRYGTGNIHGGNIGESEYFYDDIENVKDFSKDGFNYNTGTRDLFFDGFPRSVYNYGIFKGHIGANSLNNRLHTGKGTSGLGMHDLGYKNLGEKDIRYGYIGKPVVNFGAIEYGDKEGISQSHYRKGAGSNLKTGHEFTGSAGNAKGYKVTEDYDKGNKGAVEKAHNAGNYGTATAVKKGEEEETKKYSEKQATAKGHKGEDYSKSEGQKKGHKTSGFHNVYHKNEYKKDTTFYDDEHIHNHAEQFGGEQSQHTEAEGAHEKAEKVDAVHHNAEQSKEGAFTNGHQYGAVEGHGREEGGRELYEKAAEYSKEAEHKAGKEHQGSSRTTLLKKIH